MARYKIRDIQPNPFRHMDRYPIREDKVAALRESMHATGFWDNVVGRIGSDGSPEIAYGHHRLVTLRREYDPDHEVDLIIRDLDDEQMLKIMARENMEEWGTSAAVEHETVRAVVEAYAEGRIHLPQPSAKARGARYAPSFSGLSPSRLGDKPYTATSVAEFLGWTEPGGGPQQKVADALSALEFIEEGILSEEDFTGLTTMQAHAVVEQARGVQRERETRARQEQQDAERARSQAEQAEQARAKAQAEARQREEQAAREREDSARRAEAEAQARQARAAEAAAEAERERARREQRAAEQRAETERQRGREQAATVGRHVSASIRSGAAGYKQARQVAAEVRDKPSGPPPDINQVARQLATDLNRTLSPDDYRAKKLDEIILPYLEYVTRPLAGDLAAVLEEISDRALRYRDRLTPAAPDDSGVVEVEVIETTGQEELS